ncbi:exosome complex exonuclease RRP44-like [Dermacentor silvarum]|uniref:exosome complex exonuclease RRP44-like n=1 Tax=Dermacentor silvarum TaxID=543639 RepID=UPI001896D09C|nr:exosome complex exonuclease RRP44-like [Dermacentor silvarum]
MLTSKTFVKKTKKGNVLKVVREHYLRDDIWCGSKLCTKCKHENPNLESVPQSFSDLFPSPHYVVPDTNVVLHQVDVLKDAVFKNVIILQTVQQELRHRHAPGYNAIREILANKDRHFFVFTNEHHKETYIEREAGESANDRNDRAIRASVSWYCEHLTNRVDVVLLTNDEENRSKAQAQGLKACTFAEYVHSLKDHPGLLDKLAKLELDEAAKKADRRCIYPEHLPQTELHLGIKSGRFEQGKFQASRDNYLEGNVVLGDNEESRNVLIQGRSNLNRAVHEDLVVVEILPEDKWSLPSGLVLVDETQDEEDKTDEEESVKLSPTPAKSKRVPTGRIVGILRRKWRPYCGILAPSTIKEATRHLFVPAERRIPKIRIETRQAETLCRQRIVVSIDSWPRDSRYPLGHLVRALGEIGDRATENQVLLLEHDIPHQCFSRAVLDCLPSTPWTIGPKEEQGRKDLRHLCICSVDPPGCTDIDDALHCRELPSGNYEVGVHIADVSHFVRPGTALDQEAANRGTTVYLVDQRIDMVPELLSSDLCSLRGGEERLAFSVVWEITPEAEVVNTDFHKSIIKSRAALTYAEAQALIDDKAKGDELALGLRGLNKLAKLLKAKRIASGALTLASTEVRFHVDSETHDPIDVQTKQLLETNSMVEEFMLLANGSVAKHIFQEFPECALLRRHPSPAPANLEPLVKAGSSKGFDLKVDSGLHLAQSLDKAVLPDCPYFNVMLRMVATRCMARALYFCSGCVALEDFFHYGLAMSYYTHFTSPIRRYADLMVHRLLAVCVGAEGTYPQLVHKEKCQELCNNLNYRHNMAQYAGRASVALYTQAFFQDKVVDEEGYVLFVRENAVQVLMPRFGLETTLFLKEEGWKYDEEACTQSFGDITLHQFDQLVVQVSVDSRNIQHQKVVIKIVEPKIPGVSVEPAGRSESSTKSVDDPPRKKSKVCVT